MKLPLYQVDAFSAQSFGGNPAAVVPLERWLDDRTLQAIAGENNLAETAFFVREPGGYRIRWFTPQVEVDLCGHATLAAAHVLFEHLESGLGEIAFASRSGTLRVVQQGGRLALDFPAMPGARRDPPAGLAEALGGAPRELLAAMDWMAVFETEAEVRALRPDFRALAAYETRGVIATAPGNDVDFVSRFFAPRVGVDEDPVTGSAHCMLVPFWAGRLERSSLRARQISARGGELWCELKGDRVQIAGHAALYLQGTITIP
jgi:PhzF family phenazine biosynthesis protein